MTSNFVTGFRSADKKDTYNLGQSGRKKTVEGIHDNIKILGGAPILYINPGSYVNVFDQAFASTNIQPIVTSYTKKNFLKMTMIYIDRK